MSISDCEGVARLQWRRAEAGQQIGGARAKDRCHIETTPYCEVGAQTASGRAESEHLVGS